MTLETIFNGARNTMHWPCMVAEKVVEVVGDLKQFNPTTADCELVRSYFCAISESEQKHHVWIQGAEVDEKAMIIIAFLRSCPRS